jgi:thymidylate synthase (FAD)
MNEVKLIAATQGMGELEGKNAQEVITYTARVSNPSNQQNFRTAAGLLGYCIKNKHFSIFEQASMTLEINTTRAIGTQILRHRSFSFQEFSQRYSDAKLLSFPEIPELRRQDIKNRQNSIPDLPPGIMDSYSEKIKRHFEDAMYLYNNMLDSGVAKECARMILPLASPTRIYMTGTCRSWLHYIELRSANGTQKEHQDIAKKCYVHFKKVFPDVALALEEDNNGPV